MFLVDEERLAWKHFIAQDFRHRHRILWENEEAKGPIPPEYEVQFMRIFFLGDGAHQSDPGCPIAVRKRSMDGFKDGTFFRDVESAFGAVRFFLPCLNSF